MTLSSAGLQQALLLVAEGDRRQQAGQAASAADAYQQAIRACPAAPPGYLALLTLLLRLGDLGNADKVAQALPASALQQSGALRFRLGRLRLLQGRHADALPLLESARGHADLTAGFLDFNLAICHHFLGHYPAAHAHYGQAFAAGMQDAGTYGNWARLCQVMGDRETAERLYREGARRFPDNHELKYEQALFLLKDGQYPLGFRLYQHRWQSGRPQFATSPARITGLPAWDGRKPLQSLLVVAEQGIGEQIVFAGLLPALARRIPRLGVAADPRLAPLLARSFPGVAALDLRDSRSWEGYEACLPFCDLGLVASEGIGWGDGYLRPDPDRVRRIRDDYRARFPGKRLVGINWQSRNSSYSAAKSLELQACLPLLQRPDCQFISLQYGDIDAELAALRAATGIDVYRDPGVDAFNDIEGLAAQAAALDLVITGSNSGAHVAAAVHAPTWVLVPAGAGLLWYWGYAGDRCRWYPDVRLFRAATEGDWAPVIAATAAALDALPAP